ncbi:hypothetical protein L195_g001979 [Trifolium pratense]|uniref:Ig-like domain-containing protein n=1 Tax=Trifolium pratense TaxID=57577 RepID=A0A2K3NR87_TRIPR|nr:hypothetical protein L195_g001979 [Trifolium pratense]
MNEIDDHSSLTRLHSDLSSLLYQIDELVVKALEVNKSVRKEGKREIESFSNLLSEMLSSLKPWAPKLEIALSSTSVESESKSEEVTCDDSNVSDYESPKETTLVSPSPLVSWRANCTVQRGRQMFMLTPLPLSKAFLSSKPQPQTKLDFSELASSNNTSMLCGVVTKPTPIKHPLSLVTEEATINEELELISSPDFSKRDTSMLYMMTPCLKMSPPKSCVLLEPISEIRHLGNDRVRKATPFPVGVHYSDSDDSDDSESSGNNDVSRGLAMKYPELMGIQCVPKSGIVKKNVEESPVWLTSPPKTCVLLGTPDEKSLELEKADKESCIPISESILNQQVSKLNLKEDISKGHNQTQKSCNQDHFDGNLSHIESTPMWLKPENTIQRGKRAGENTLKKELWAKFEEASTCGFEQKCHTVSKNSQKGFLDLLEEASCDD